jgi:hypothetical protein
MIITSMERAMTDPLKIKLLEFCKPGELVRIVEQWAIVGHHPAGRCLVYISGDGAPKIADFSTQQPAPCLSFGTEFDLLPVYNAECDMISPFVRGSLYYASRDGKGDATRHLAVISDYDNAMFLRLNDFAYGNDVGVPQGAQFGNFRRWGIWMKLPPHPDPICLYCHG